MTDASPPSAEGTSPPARSARGEMFVGLGVGLGVSAGCLALCFLMPPLIAVFGVLQIVWVWPLAAYYRRRARPEAAQGVWIGAALTLLLSGACWGTVFYGLSSSGFH